MKEAAASGTMVPEDRAAAQAGAPKSKKPYVAPVLKRLGSVRELTLAGGSIHATDGRTFLKHG
ncbi:MAG: lasso RiPP family leader peptide-containing protein [Polyangiaceae bacterium]|jgi:hypothetical protein